MARAKKIKGRRIDDEEEVVVEYSPNFDVYTKHEDKYQGTPVIFCECQECKINYEYGELYYPTDDNICLYCLNDMKPPLNGKHDYILETELHVECDETVESYLIDEDCIDDWEIE